MNYKLKHNLSHTDRFPLESLLMAQGIENIEGYINPSSDYEQSPYDLENIKEAAMLLFDEMEKNSKTLLVVDADCDGFCSSAILWLYIKNFWPEANLHYVCHENKAHGLDDIIDDIEESDYDLVICPDASSFDYTEHERLAKVGKKVLVLDHHSAPRYSENAVVVNNQLSPNYHNKGLCGAGIVYRFCQVMDDIMGEPHSDKYTDLCALANIADCMSPKNLETRYYIHKGLNNIVNDGFKALIKQQEFSLFRNSRDLNYIKIAFYIAPLINAIVRVGTMKEKNDLFELFINPNIMVQSDKRGAKVGEMETLATQVARKAANARSRQNRTKDKAVDLLDCRIHKYDLLEHKIIVIEVNEKDGIPQELTGLLATQFVNKYSRPCLIVRRNSEGYLRGSMRGNENFSEVPNLQKFLLDSNVMDYCEGHHNAAGVSIHESKLEDLLEYADTTISDAGLENTYYVDYIFNYNESFAALALALTEQENIWGNDVEEPTIVVESIPLTSKDFMVMGAEKDSVKFSRNGIEYVKFKDADFVQQLNEFNRFNITVYGRLGRNVWAGRTTPQVIIEDFDIKNTDDEF